jgi:hypothetical protein
MFWVEYYCPCPGQAAFGWQRGKTAHRMQQQAEVMAMYLKPPNGQARVINQFGVVVFNA